MLAAISSSRCGRFGGRTSLRGTQNVPAWPGATGCGRFGGRTSLRGPGYAGRDPAAGGCGRFGGRTSLRVGIPLGSQLGVGRVAVVLAAALH